MAKKPAAKKSTPAEVTDVKSKKDAKKDKKKADDEGLLQEGIPDSQYIQFQDKRWMAFFSAVLGTPGPMAGKVWEIAGKSDAGKTALALQILIELQKQGEKCFYNNAERSMTKERAQQAGLDVKKVLYAEPNGGEQGFRVIGLAMEKGAKYGIVDSSSALKPLAMAQNMNGGDGSGGMAAQARLMSAEMPNVEKVVADAKGLVIFISQVKDKPGVTFGNPEYISSGGSALGFHSRVRITLRKVEVEKDKETKQMNRFTVRLTVTKNHTGPNRTTPFDLVVDHMFRIDWAATAVAWAKQFNLVNEDNQTVAGLPYKGKGTTKDLIAAVDGQEDVVMNAVDSYFRSQIESGKQTQRFEEQEDSTDDLLKSWADEEEETSTADADASPEKVAL